MYETAAKTPLSDMPDGESFSFLGSSVIIVNVFLSGDSISFSFYFSTNIIFLAEIAIYIHFFILFFDTEVYNLYVLKIDKCINWTQSTKKIIYQFMISP